MEIHSIPHPSPTVTEMRLIVISVTDSPDNEPGVVTSPSGLNCVTKSAGSLDHNSFRFQVETCPIVVLDNLPQEADAVYVALSDSVHPRISEDVLLKDPQPLVVIMVDWTQDPGYHGLPCPWVALELDALPSSISSYSEEQLPAALDN